MYSIVEFKDGVFAIPTIWLNTDKTNSRWPPYDERKVLKAVSKKEVPNTNWDTLSVIRVFGIAADYDTAMRKVSLAEQISDLSDSENAKKSRKIRAHRIETSESSEEEKCSPKKKSKAIASTKTAIEPVTYAEFPSISAMLPLNSLKTNDKSKPIKRDIANKIEHEKNTSTKADNENDVTMEKNHTFLNTNKTMEYNTSTKTYYENNYLAKIDHTFLTTDEKLDYLIELHTLSIKKENVMLCKLNALHNRLSELIKAEPNKDKIEDNDEDDDTIINLLPIKDAEQMNNSEEKLKRKEFYTKVMLFIVINFKKLRKIT